MLGWLLGLLNIITGPLKALWNDVVSLVTTVWKWTAHIADTLYHDILSVYGDVVRLSDGIAHWISSVYGHFVKWVENEFNAVIRFFSNAITDIRNWISDASRWLTKAFDDVYHFITAIVTDVRSWVLQDIWNPLFSAISGAIRWIEHEGAYVFDLVTHPEKLVLLLIAYIWSAWLDLFRKFTKPIIGWLLANWKSVIPDIESVIEDILTHLL